MIHIDLSAKSLLMILLLLVTFLFTSAAVTGVSPLNNYLQEYKGKHLLILKAIEDSPLSISEKLKLYEKEVSQLKTEFKTARQKEYEAIAIPISVRKSCTSKKSGGTKDCGYACVSAPNQDMYTREDWMTVKLTNKGTKLDPEGNSACLRMTVAGNNTNKGILTAIYRHKLGRIAAIVDQEIASLFNQVFE